MRVHMYIIALLLLWAVAGYVFFYLALNDLGGLAANQLAAINCPPEETAMWTLLAIAAASSIAFGLIAVGLAIWHDARPSTDKERAHLRP